MFHNFLIGYICKNIQKVTLTNDFIGFVSYNKDRREYEK